MTSDAGQVFGMLRVGTFVFGVEVEHLCEVSHFRELKPLMVSSEFQRGGIELRDQLIPTVDLGLLQGIDETVSDGRQVAVLRCNARLLAVIIDGIVGLATTAEGDIRQLDGAAEARCCPNKGVFLEGGVAVTILDVEGLFALPGVHSVQMQTVGQSRKLAAETVPMLSFEAGGAYFCLQAVDVYGSVPRQAIPVSAITSGLCLGEITHHGRRIPIVCATRALGLGAKPKRDRPEIVVVKCDNDQLLGLAVDAIRKIEPVPVSHQAALPTYIDQQSRLLKGVIVDRSDAQVFVIDTEALQTDVALRPIIDLFKPSSAPPRDTALKTPRGSGFSREHKRYLIISAPGRMAVPLSQVNQIIRPPEQVTQTGAGRRGLLGFFGYRGHSVPLIDLSAYLGGCAKGGPTARVLIAGPTSSPIGFLVDHVHEIERSGWKNIEERGHGRAPEVMVQFTNSDGSYILVMADIAKAAERDFAVAFA